MRSLSVRLWQGPARQSSISLGSAKTGGKGIRTPDLLIANETLYQLSYTPKEEQQLSWRNDFSASDSENSEQPICYYLSVDGK